MTALEAVAGAAMVVAAVVGGLASVLLFGLPLKLGLIAACLLGLMAGLLTERITANGAAT